MVAGVFDGKTVGQSAHALDKFMIIIRFVVGTFGKFGCHHIEVPLHGVDPGESLCHLVDDTRAVGQIHLLGQISDGEAIGHRHRARCRLLQPRDYLKHRRFPGAVLADKSYLVLGVDDIIDIVKQRFRTEFYRQIVY